MHFTFALDLWDITLLNVNLLDQRYTHLDLFVFKTSWRCLQDMSSRRLPRNNFSSSKTSWRHLRKMSWKTKNCYAEDVLKTNKCLLGIYWITHFWDRIISYYFWMIKLKKWKIFKSQKLRLSVLLRCGPRFLGRCRIKQIGHHGWSTKKILSSWLSKTCLNHIFYIFFSIRTNILIVYCALQINGTVSLWSALYGFSVAACVMYASHNFTKTNVKTEFQKYINS